MPNWERLSTVCYHYAEIVSSCTSFEPTTRQQSGSAVCLQSGSAVCLLVPQCQTLPSVDGYVMMASSPFTDAVATSTIRCLGIVAFQVCRKKKKEKKKLYFVMVTMSRLNRDFQWAIRDQQSLLRARFLHLIMKHAWSESRTADQRHAKRMC